MLTLKGIKSIRLRIPMWVYRLRVGYQIFISDDPDRTKRKILHARLYGASWRTVYRNIKAHRAAKKEESNG